MAVNEDRLRAEFVGGAQRHGGMNPYLAGLVRSRRNHTAFVGASADDYSLAAQAGVEELFHRDEEGVHIDVEDSARGCGSRLHTRILASSRAAGSAILTTVP